MNDFDGGWEDVDGVLAPSNDFEMSQMAESVAAEQEHYAQLDQNAQPDQYESGPDESKHDVPNPYISHLLTDNNTSPPREQPSRPQREQPRRPQREQPRRPQREQPSRKSQRDAPSHTSTTTTIYRDKPSPYVDVLNPGLLSLRRRELENREKVYDTYDFDRERRLRDLWVPWISIEHESYDRKMIETEIEDLVQREIQKNVYGVGISNVKLIKLIKDVIRKYDDKYLKKPTKPRKPPKKKKSKKKSKKKPAKKSKKKPAKKSKKKSKKKPAKKSKN
jgi:hypothetical protein